MRADHGAPPHRGQESRSQTRLACLPSVEPSYTARPFNPPPKCCSARLLALPRLSYRIHCGVDGGGDLLDQVISIVPARNTKLLTPIQRYIDGKRTEYHPTG